MCHRASKQPQISACSSYEAHPKQRSQGKPGGKEGQAAQLDHARGEEQHLTPTPKAAAYTQRFCTSRENSLLPQELFYVLCTSVMRSHLIRRYIQSTPEMSFSTFLSAK